MKIYQIIFKKFSNKIYIPPKLRTKNPVKANDTKKKQSPIYNLLKSQKLVESTGEKINIEERLDYETIISDAAKQMLLSYYKIYEDKTERHKEVKNLYECLKKFYTPNEINLFLTHFKWIKNIINTQDVQKTEEIFKMFIDRVYNINNNKSKSNNKQVSSNIS
jgi:hypothetical protein